MDPELLPVSATPGTPPPEIRGFAYLDVPSPPRDLSTYIDVRAEMQHIHDAARLFTESPPSDETWRFVVPYEVAIDLAAQLQVLTTCRDHWKTSYDHERANVIRLRNLVSVMHNFNRPGGSKCVCVDCQLVRQYANPRGWVPLEARATGVSNVEAAGQLLAQGVHAQQLDILNAPLEVIKP